MSRHCYACEILSPDYPQSMELNTCSRNKELIHPLEIIPRSSRNIPVLISVLAKIIECVNKDIMLNIIIFKFVLYIFHQSCYHLNHLCSCYRVNQFSGVQDCESFAVYGCREY